MTPTVSVLSHLPLLMGRRFTWALLLAMAACEGGATAPTAGPLRVDSVTPRPFRAGGIVTIWGQGLEDASVTFDGVAGPVLVSSPGRLEVQASRMLPECRSDLPPVRVRVSAGGAAEDREVATLGRPLGVSLEPGGHVVLEEVRAGCAVAFPEGGVYGAALYRVANPEGSSDSERRSRRSYALRLAEAGEVTAPGRPDPSLASMAPPSPLLPTPGRRALRGRRSAAQEATCRREPARVGDVLVLENPWETVQGEYQVISVSDHFQVVAPRYALAYYPPSRRARAEGFATEVEERAYPLLARVFREWPDTEGDGRLTLILSDGMSAAGGGLIARYVDGCDGDFITMGNEFLDSAADAESNNAVGVFVHEATHWYDRFDYGDNGLWHPEWSVEAVASLVERLWMWELKGRGFWEQAPLACPAGASCALHMMQEDRYGWPGLSHDGGYGHGLHILHYLVQQAVPHGAEPHDAIGTLPDRLTVRGDLRLTPVFRAMGGTGRTEEELQGEYLLSFYADGHVEGASARILQPSWDLPAVNPSYPLRHFVLSTTEPAATAALARPDGIVFEVVAEPGSTLFVTPAAHHITLALVRRD